MCVCVCVQEVCEVAGDSVLDLVDYCHRRLVALLAEGAGKGCVVTEVEEEEEGGSESEDEEEEKKKQILKELREQEKALSFGITMKTISILQYITDHLDM